MSRRRFLGALALGVAPALATAGCGGATPVATFNLSAPERAAGARAGSGQLVVMEPNATAPYDSDRVVVTPAPGAVAYLKGAQWAEQLPRLLQSRMIEAFDNSRLLRAVGRPGDRLVATVSLNSEIRRFDIDVASGQAVVELSVKMIDDSRGRIRAARIVSARLPGSAADGKGAADALDRAFAQVLRELVAWSSRYV